MAEYASRLLAEGVEGGMAENLNWNSKQLTRGWQQALTSFYWGLGFEESDFDKAQVGIGVPLLEGNLCNVHAYQLGAEIKAGCEEAGLIGFPFGVPGISDNLTQGHEGGSGSLPSRNLIANAAECVVSAHCYDAMVGLHHCDKNGPGFAMALARMNIPGLIASGGTILPGCHRGKEVTSADPYDAAPKVASGDMDESEFKDLLRSACPGPGGCGIAASFNTWGMGMEAIGLMLPFSSSNPAEGGEKEVECRAIGKAIKVLLEKDIRPRDILTRRAFENAAAAIAAVGGSTNGVLHLLALAREAGVPFTLADMQEIFRRTPVLCNFAPRGTKTMIDLHRLGGTPVLMKHLLKAGILDGSCLTVTGRTLEDNLRDAGEVPEDQDLIAPIAKPFKAHADIQVCFGNLAPDGIVFKVSSMQETSFRGKAICFDHAREVATAVEEGKIEAGSVCVLRHLGPVASGMPEVLVASAALAVPELYGKVAMISDTRVSGVSHGAIGVHCAPEAAVGGPIGLVRDGDAISFDLLQGTIALHVDEDVLQAREREQTTAPPVQRRAYLGDFARTVSQANEGCVSLSRLEALEAGVGT